MTASGHSVDECFSYTELYEMEDGTVKDEQPNGLLFKPFYGGLYILLVLQLHIKKKKTHLPDIVYSACCCIFISPAFLSQIPINAHKCVCNLKRVITAFSSYSLQIKFDVKVLTSLGDDQS